MIERFQFRRVNEITGVFVLVVIAVLIAAVVWTGHSQRWFKSRVLLRIALPEGGAAGIRQGSEVYFLGTLVGSVSDVIVDAAGRMEAQAQIRNDFFRFVRADSSAVVKRKFGVAGDSFFEITRGEGQPLPEKNAAIMCSEQLQSSLEAAIEDIRREVLVVLKQSSTGLETWTRLGGELSETRLQLDLLTGRLGKLAAGVEAGQGTAGRLLSDNALADDLQLLLRRANETMGGLQTMVTNLNAAAKHVEQGTTRLPAFSDSITSETQKLMARADVTLSGLQSVVTNLHAAAVNARLGTLRLPEITDAVADEARDLPGLVRQTQTSMREMERLMEAMQHHWLVRKYVNPTNPAPLRSSGGTLR